MTADRSSRALGGTPPGIEIAGASDRGTVRTENQDAWTALVLSHARVALLLADGMGGHTGGGEAADEAISAAARSLEAAPADVPPTSLLNDACAAAGAAVAELRAQIGGNPGTTLVLALVEPSGRATIANIGDSRAYRLASSGAIPLTEDHSWVSEQVRLGLLDAASARHHARRNIITRAVLGSGELPDVTETTLAAGETLLLCSDGVWEPLTDTQLAGAVESGEPLLALVENLCETALSAGSRDNVTVVAARFG